MSEAGVNRTNSGNPVDISPRTAPVSLQSSTNALLDLVEVVLQERGWCQGRRIDRSGRLSLEAAADEAASQVATTAAGQLALADRATNRLSRAGGIGSLAAWNDHQARQLRDITELIALARFGDM